MVIYLLAVLVVDNVYQKQCVYNGINHSDGTTYDISGGKFQRTNNYIWSLVWYTKTKVTQSLRMVKPGRI